MRLFDQLSFRIRALVRGRRVHDEVEREMQFHVDMETARLVASGIPRDEARRRASVDFGGRQRFREETRDEIHGRALTDLAQDLRHAARTFRRTPVFTITVLLTLAIGIGATTTIFSVTDDVVLRSLPVSRVDRMMSVEVRAEGLTNIAPTIGPNAAHYLAWKAACSACEDMALVHAQTVILYDAGDPAVVPAMRVSDNLFAMLGARAQLGRLIAPGDDTPNARVVAISDALWRQQFGARRDIVGQRITLGGAGIRYTVVGVTAPDFPSTYGNLLASFSMHPVRADVFFPLGLLPYQRTTPGEYDYGLIVLPRPGVTTEAIRAELDAISVANVERLRDNAPRRSVVTPLQRHVVGAAERPLLLLLAAVAAMLLIMCVNLANLFVARSTARRRESAVRVALGAGHGRLVRQALTETVALAVVGGAAGIVISRWGVRALVALAPPELPRLNEVHVDARIVAVAVIISILAGLAFGFVPALRFGRTHPGDVLKESARGASGGRSSARLRSALIASQVGLSALLLVVGGLFLKSFLRVIHADKGFTTERVLAVDVPLTPMEYRTGDARNAFFDEAMRRINALPGVVGTALTSAVPLEGESWVDGVSRLAPDGTRDAEIAANFRFITPNYFALMGVPIVAGRSFENSDRGTNRMIISENLARTLWPGESAIGKRAPTGDQQAVHEVIGVVADVRTSGIEHAPSLILYEPYWEFGRAENILVRTNIDPASLAPQVRRIIHALSPTAPIAKIRTMDEIISSVVAERRFELILIELFALTALLTASIGIYGVISHSLGRRTNEIGIRIALGAEPSGVHALVLRETSWPVAIGLAVGLFASVAAGRAIASLLYEVRPTDAIVLGSVALLLAIVAELACWIPSRRAARIDPVDALRST